MTIFMLIPLRDTMHSISSGLLIPTIAVLLVFLGLVVIEFGSLLVEIMTERRRAKFDVPGIIDSFQVRDAGEILGLIDSSGLFRRHKLALSELIKQIHLPDASQQAIARRLLTGEELYYAGITNRTDLVARLGPMFGLMATLIPLGPGLIALGQGDTKTLADSLLTAFDATVAGLAAAGVAFAISRLRKRWYEDYLSTLETLMEGLLEVTARDRGIEEKCKAQVNA